MKTALIVIMIISIICCLLIVYSAINIASVSDEAAERQYALRRKQDDEKTK